MQTLKFTAKSLSDTEFLSKIFANIIKNETLLICLYGDIGSGKTTFVKKLAANLGIKEKVTSPSFVILNEYFTNTVKIKHFDLYRLEQEGIETILEELEEYTEDENTLTLMEWAEFSSGNLPENRLEIQIKYLDENSREFIIQSYGNKHSNLFKELQKELTKTASN